VIKSESVKQDIRLSHTLTECRDSSFAGIKIELTDAAQDHGFLPDTFSLGTILQGHRIGHVRVSASTKDPERQLKQMQAGTTFIDKAPGKNTQHPQLDMLLGFVREDDTVVAYDIFRFVSRPLKRLFRSKTQCYTRNFTNIFHCFSMIYCR
jgi:hypothetical protein